MIRTKYHLGFARLCAMLLVLASGLSAVAVQAQGEYWERIPIVHTLPSRIFNELGLTHITRNGYTRGVPHGHDEDFPAGMTDIVPYDTLGLLIVRGTVEAVAEFRQRVLSLDVPPPTYTVQFRLIDPKSDAVLGIFVKTNALMDDSEVANVSDGAGAHSYRFHLYPALHGQVAIVMRTGVNTAQSGGLTVFAPSVVWLDPVSKTTAVSTPVVFNDLASQRASVSSGLGAGAAANGTDYNVEVTVTPNTPAPASTAPAAPTAPGPAGGGAPLAPVDPAPSGAAPAVPTPGEGAAQNVQPVEP